MVCFDFHEIGLHYKMQSITVGTPCTPSVHKIHKFWKFVQLIAVHTHIIMLILSLTLKVHFHFTLLFHIFLFVCLFACIFRWQKYKDLDGEVIRKNGIILLRELTAEVKNFMDFKMNAVLVSVQRFASHFGVDSFSSCFFSSSSQPSSFWCMVVEL